MKTAEAACSVRAPVPQKQGLKPIQKALLVSILEVRAPVPQKQGLKPSALPSVISFVAVRAPVPQKQGLKRYVEKPI